MRLAHMRLELGEGVFDRIEVGTVGRQIAEFGAAGFNSLPDTRDLVGGQIVHDDNVAETPGWRQHLLDLGACPNSPCSILSESDSTLGYEQVFSSLEYRSDAVPAAECAGLCAERPCLAVYR
jgi:hypothetical protein